MRPPSKRLRRRSSSVGMSLGGRSLLTTICFLSKRALKVWKNSSWVWSLPARNWMSSMSRTSTLAVALAELAGRVVLRSRR